MKLRTRIASQVGFSLVEVMVALLVVSIGMLGIAKMQALALASTGTAKMRALAAIEAASLASTMHADRLYWASIAVNETVAVQANGAVVATGDTTLATPPATQCLTTATLCTSAQIAAQDLSDWAKAVSATLPGGTALLTCNVASATNPVNCNVVLTWAENVVGMNTSTNTAATAAQNNAALTAASYTQTQYTLYVEP